MKIPKDPSHGKNWTSAQDLCAEEGGTLVAIENEVEQGRAFNIQSGKNYHFYPLFIIQVFIKNLLKIPPEYEHFQINILSTILLMTHKFSVWPVRFIS